MRSSDWSSDVCSSDLFFHGAALAGPAPLRFSVRTKPQSHKNFLKSVRPELVEGPFFLWALRKSGASTSSAQTGINKVIFFVASWLCASQFSDRADARQPPLSPPPPRTTPPPRPPPPP